MPRTAPVSSGGMAFHVLNRRVGRMQMFRAGGNYDAFHRGVEYSLLITPMRRNRFASPYVGRGDWYHIHKLVETINAYRGVQWKQPE